MSSSPLPDKPPSAEEFLRHVLHSGLFEREELQASLRGVPREQRDDAQALADHLVRARRRHEDAGAPEALADRVRVEDGVGVGRRCVGLAVRREGGGKTGEDGGSVDDHFGRPSSS